MEIKVIEKQLPVVKTNFKLMKEFLSNQLKKYEGVIVTKDSLESDKLTKKEMTTLRKNIDDERKKIKKELLVPIDVMEDECKELIGIVDKVLIPLKEGLNVFDDKIRQANIDYAQQRISDISETLSLNKEDFIIPSNFTNLTMTKKNMTIEINRQASELKQKKDDKLKNIELLKSNIEQLNKSFDLEVGLTFVEYEDKITGDNFLDLSQVMLQDATKRKETQDKLKLKFEEKAIQQKEEQQNNIVAEVKKEVNESTGEITEKLTISLKLTGTDEQLRGMRTYIDGVGITYVKL